MKTPCPACVCLTTNKSKCGEGVKGCFPARHPTARVWEGSKKTKKCVSSGTRARQTKTAAKRAVSLFSSWTAHDIVDPQLQQHRGSRHTPDARTSVSDRLPCVLRNARLEALRHPRCATLPRRCGHPYLNLPYPASTHLALPFLTLAYLILPYPSIPYPCSTYPTSLYMPRATHSVYTQNKKRTAPRVSALNTFDMHRKEYRYHFQGCTPKCCVLLQGLLALGLFRGHRRRLQGGGVRASSSSSSSSPPPPPPPPPPSPPPSPDANKCLGVCLV